MTLGKAYFINSICQEQPQKAFCTREPTEKSASLPQPHPHRRSSGGGNLEQLGVTRSSCGPAAGVGPEPISAPAHTHLPVSGVQDASQKGMADCGHPCAWACCLAVSMAMSDCVQFSFFTSYFGCNVPVPGWGPHLKEYELELLLRPQNGCRGLMGKATCLGSEGRWI